MIKFQIVNIRTKEYMGKPHKKIRSARNRADKLDLIYGAINYSIKPVEVNSN